jgi:hypothetical protein
MPPPLSFSLVLLLLFASVVDALHFYLDANEKRCFIEEIPTDTVVEGLYGVFVLQMDYLHLVTVDRPLSRTRVDGRTTGVWKQPRPWHLS